MGAIVSGLALVWLSKKHANPVQQNTNNMNLLGEPISNLPYRMGSSAAKQ